MCVCLCVCVCVCAHLHMHVPEYVCVHVRVCGREWEEGGVEDVSLWRAASNGCKIETQRRKKERKTERMEVQKREKKR